MSKVYQVALYLVAGGIITLLAMRPVLDAAAASMGATAVWGW